MRSLALALVALLLSLALGEAVLRAVGASSRRSEAPVDRWAQENPVLGWEARPGSTHSDEAGDVIMNFWPDGERVSWSDPNKPALSNVLLLGCSFTEGQGVRDEETFAWRLNEMYPDVRFENHAVAGYGTYQSLLEVEQLQRTWGRAPDLVVYGFIGDHRRRNVAQFEWIERLAVSRALYLVPPHVTLEAGELVFHPMALIDWWPLEHSSAWLRALHDLWLRIQFLGRGAYKLDATDRLIDRFDQRVRELGSKLLVVLLANVPRETPAFLEEHRIPYVDCANPDYGKDPTLQVGGVGHPSGRQHALWAECLGRYFDAQHLFVAK